MPDATAVRSGNRPSESVVKSHSQAPKTPQASRK